MRLSLFCATALISVAVTADTQRRETGQNVLTNLGNHSRLQGSSASAPGVVSTDVNTSRRLRTNLPDVLSINNFDAACDGLTDDSIPLSRAAIALNGTGRTLMIPGSCRLYLGTAAQMAGIPVMLDTITIEGESGRDGGTSGEAYGNRGSTLIQGDAIRPELIVQRNVSLRHLIFYTPAINDAAALANGGTPPVYPAVISGQGSAGNAPSEVSSFRLEDSDVVVASNVIDFHKDIAGGLIISHNRAFFEGVFLNLGAMPVESFIHDNDFTPNGYQSAPGVVRAGPQGDYTLSAWAGSHAEVVRASGNGSANIAETSGSIDGLNFHDNYVFGIAYGLRAIGGTFNLISAFNNTFDGVARPLSLETGGSFNGRFSGGEVYSYTFRGASKVSTPVLYVSSDSAPGTSITSADLRVQSASGQLLEVKNTINAVNVTLTAPTALNLNSASGGTADGIRFSSPGSLAVLGGTIQTLGSSGSCINFVTPAYTAVVQGVTFLNCGYVASYSGSFGFTAIAVANNVSVGTRTGIYGGTAASALPDTFNVWDRPHPGWSLGPRTSDGAYVLSFGGIALLSLAPTSGALKTFGEMTSNTTP